MTQKLFTKTDAEIPEITKSKHVIFCAARIRICKLQQRILWKNMELQGNCEQREEKLRESYRNFVDCSMKVKYLEEDIASVINGRK